MKTYWVCVAARWAVPPSQCEDRGDTYTSGDRHCIATGHPIFTTTIQATADRLAEQMKELAA